MSSFSVSGYELEWCNLFVKFFLSMSCVMVVSFYQQQ
jgi:hypothetical protein